MRDLEELVIRTLERRLNELEDLVRRLANQHPAIGPPPSGGSGNTRLGYASSGGLSARSGTTLGSGNVDIFKVDDGALVDQDETIEAFSLDDEAISAGKLVAVTVIDGAVIATRLECEDA